MSTPPSARRQFTENQIFDATPTRSPIAIVAEKLGIDERTAREALVALAREGYVVAPREPTNAMLIAYMESYGHRPDKMTSTITAIGKARLRWKAMAEAGLRVSLSLRRLTTHAQARGGRARADSLSAERRSEIARAAAQARWGKNGSE